MTRSNVMLILLLSLFGTATIIGCAATDDRESTGSYVDNSIITGKVKTAFAAEQISSLLNVEVATFRGVVQLSGFVDDEQIKEMAGNIAAGVDGVDSVENSLVVKPDA